MSPSGRNRVEIPSGIGSWETTLSSKNLDASPGVMRNCAAAFGVVFMEEDSTHDSTILEALPIAKKEIRRLANTMLRLFLGVPPDVPAGVPGRAAIIQALQTLTAQLANQGLNVNGNNLVNANGLIDYIMAAVLPNQVGIALGTILAPGGEAVGWISAAVQAADRDEYIGSNGRTFSFFDLVGRAHAPTTFDLDTITTTSIPLPGIPDPVQLTNTANGIYAVTGSARRSDSDEPPTLAAIRGPGDKVTVFARRLDGDFFQRKQSNDFGLTYKAVPGGDFGKGVFRSGPAAASAVGGTIQCAAGLGTDDEIWCSVSGNAGATWGAWTRIAQRKKFASAPAVALSTNGSSLYVVGRDDNDFYWFNSSEDRGRSWSEWRPIGRGVFHSSPAIVRLSDPRLPLQPFDVLVAAGLGTDKRVYTTRFSATERLDDQVWSPISGNPESTPASEFTSAPAMATDGREQILIVCRARNLLYWRAMSFDAGRNFHTGTSWLNVGEPGRGPVRYDRNGSRRGDLQDMYSAPAVVASDDMERWLLFGLSPTLGLWRNQCTRSDPDIWRPTTAEPEPAARVQYY
jgi:hypothetical protein